MNLLFKYIILYIIPIISVAGVFGIYMLLYGKHSESTFSTLSISYLCITFIVFSFISYPMVEQCLSQKEIMSSFKFFTQIFLIGLACIIELVICIGGIYILYSESPI